VKVGIMQPYFCPYIGYFSLIKHTDMFILFDTVQFIRDSTLLPISKNKVLSVSKINDLYYRIQFEHKLPDELKANDGIENITWYPETIIRNNVVRNNRARGFLISSGKPVLIEHNSIS